MGIEIERKFLMKDESWRIGASSGIPFCQGYLLTGSCTVRVRSEGERGVLTIKGPTSGCVRSEFEYAIPFADAREMLETLAQKPLIRKIRYDLSYAGQVWVVDEFFDENAGLVLAEIELSREDESFLLPPWIGEEVTSDSRYRNAALVTCPYNVW